VKITYGLIDVMTRFDLPRLTMLLFQCQLLEASYEERIARGMGNLQLVEQEKIAIIKFLKDADTYGRDVGFSDTQSQAAVVWARLSKRPELYDSSAVCTELRNINSQIMSEPVERSMYIKSIHLGNPSVRTFRVLSVI
jgi:hypothetical protein